MNKCVAFHLDCSFLLHKDRDESAYSIIIAYRGNKFSIRIKYVNYMKSRYNCYFNHIILKIEQDG